ncbi:MAG: cation:proton antiporter [Pseudomonadota bacterium]
MASSATRPSPVAGAAIADVIRQSGIRNGFSETLTGIVAVDDVWGLIVFSLCLSLVQSSGGWTDPLVHAVRDIGGAALLGAAVGVGAAYLTGRLKPGEPLQTEAIGVVFLTAGLAIWLGVSFLVAGMTAGAIVANLARHHEYAFKEIEHIEWPFMLLFFVLAGATLELSTVWSLGWITAVYVALRIVSRIVGAEIGAAIGQVPQAQRHVFGPALLPQAGVAVGMALVASETMPQWGPTIMTLTVAATVVLELVGPPCTLAAIRYVQRAEARTS